MDDDTTNDETTSGIAPIDAIATLLDDGDRLEFFAELQHAMTPVEPYLGGDAAPLGDADVQAKFTHVVHCVNRVVRAWEISVEAAMDERWQAQMNEAMTTGPVQAGDVYLGRAEDLLAAG